MEPGPPEPLEPEKPEREDGHRYDCPVKHSSLPTDEPARTRRTTHHSAAGCAGGVRRGRTIGREQPPDPVDKGSRCLAIWQARPLHLAKAVRNVGPRVTRVVDDNWNQKRHALRHVVRPVHRQLPLSTEVPFPPSLGVSRNHRDEQLALADLLADGSVPDIPAPKLALIEPNLDAGR